MAIAKGEDWGSAVSRPPRLRVAADDAELAHMLTDGTSLPTAVAQGDLFRTIGAPAIGDRAELLEFAIDTMWVTIGESPAVPAVAHVVAHRPRVEGGWLRGVVLFVMNAEFIGEFDVAPRGHPSDGRVESLVGAAEMPIRQRLAFRRRMRTATHLPHPNVVARSVRTASWEFPHDVVVRVDGIVRGRARFVEIEVRADAATLYA